jgi:hypothetical protein
VNISLRELKSDGEADILRAKNDDSPLGLS